MAVKKDRKGNVINPVPYLGGSRSLKKGKPLDNSRSPLNTFAGEVGQSFQRLNEVPNTLKQMRSDARDFYGKVGKPEPAPKMQKGKPQSSAGNRTGMDDTIAALNESARRITEPEATAKRTVQDVKDVYSKLLLKKQGVKR